MKQQSDDRNVYGDKEERDFHLEKGVDGVTVIGDKLGRLPFVEFVDAQQGERVLEAGCGGGWVARKLAACGAQVIGCDKTQEMLDDAIKIENELKQGINYVQADIIQLPFQAESFDKVVNIATLFHLDADECRQFFQEAVRVLKPHGELFLSLNHFDLFQLGNPVREQQTDWMTLEPKAHEITERSQLFTEQYWNKNGNVFVVDIWYHPKTFLLKLIQECHLEIIQERSNYLTDEILHEFGRKGEGNYAAFWQVRLRKR